MKLLKKTNRYFVASLILILVLSACTMYVGSIYLLHEEAKEQLTNDEIRISSALQQGKIIQSTPPFFLIQKTNKTVHAPKFSSVSIYDEFEKENELYEEISSVRMINGQTIEIKVRQAAIESDELLFVFAIIFVGVMLFGLLIVFLINRSLLKRLWNPFYTTLDDIHSFSIENGKAIDFKETPIQEFNELNHAIENMSLELIRDYLTLKEFTENASHEIQTPLAILTLNLEEALQAELNEDASQKIYKAYQAANRLSKLNEKLLLLTKLDNGQFNFKERVDLSSVSINLLEDLTPLFEQKSIQIGTIIDHSFMIESDKELATILVSNILTNALKYGSTEGTLNVHSTEEQIEFSNNTQVNIDVEPLFNRFHKVNTKDNSLGLGLSIVEKIASLCQLQVELVSNNKEFKVIIKKIDQNESTSNSL